MSSDSKSRVRIFLTGICMGAADLVPGVSGGTIAFISGLYSDLIHAITCLNLKTAQFLFKGKWKTFSQAAPWSFLVILFLGMGTAILTLSPFIHHWLHSEVSRTLLFSLFFGLILGSVLHCARQVPNWSWMAISALILGVFFAWGVTSVNSAHLSSNIGYQVPFNIEFHIDSPPKNYDIKESQINNVLSDELYAMISKGVIAPDLQVYDPALEEWITASEAAGNGPKRINPLLILAGVAAVSAMLLPGISGSYLLNVFGVYPEVIGALAQVSSMLRGSPFQSEPFWLLMNLGTGIVIGLIVFSRFLKWMLLEFPSITLALLTGFMIGSLRSIWPFWTYQKVLHPLKLDQGLMLIPDQIQVPTEWTPLVIGSISIVVASSFLIMIAEWWLLEKKN